MFTEELNRKIAQLFVGADNHYSFKVTISHDDQGFHFNVHIGGWIGDICTSGSGQSRVSLDEALDRALATRQQIGKKDPH